MKRKLIYTQNAYSCEKICQDTIAQKSKEYYMQEKSYTQKTASKHHRTEHIPQKKVMQQFMHDKNKYQNGYHKCDNRRQNHDNV